MRNSIPTATQSCRRKCSRNRFVRMHLAPAPQYHTRRCLRMAVFGDVPPRMVFKLQPKTSPAHLSVRKGAATSSMAPPVFTRRHAHNGVETPREGALIAVATSLSNCGDWVSTSFEHFDGCLDAQFSQIIAWRHAHQFAEIPLELRHRSA